MARATTTYRCTDCGWTSTKWVGRCGECQAWGTVDEVGAVRARTTASATRTAAVPIGEVDIAAARAVPTGSGELDRVLGGGLVPGAVLLLESSDVDPTEQAASARSRRSHAGLSA